ncbi:L,D-transpeptidase family protein [Lagierella sp.]|uniref:L,D-transpeptidase family protein n=1 Tax=Lagierella sp. TaxID=2849657 RepID=UPI0026139B91|nr:L,D-transpeptidase family protein [Lagierella sp.]
MKKGVIIPIVAIVAVYLGGALLFNNYSYPSTTVNGEKKSFKKITDITNPNYDNYELIVEGKNDKEDKFTVEDLNFNIEEKNPVEINQNSLIWPIELLKKHDYKVDYNYTLDDKKLEQSILESKLNQDVEKSKDASVELVENKYEIIPEKVGDELNLDKTKEKIVQAFKDKADKIKLEEEEYILPKLTKDSPELKEELDKREKLFSTILTFDFDDRKVELKGDELIAFYDKAQDGYVLNRQRVRDYVADLAKKTDTFGIDRKFNTTGRGEVTVGGGIYGWQMNVDKTTDQVIKDIEEGNSKTVDIDYKLHSLTRATNDIGNTYIEIDLTRQHLWFYKEGKVIVESDVITGLPYGGNETPTGVFKVWSRETDRNLTGEDYSSPVSFWMPINWGGVGLHDAPWQSSFGGDLYKTRGSHGCINLPYDVAKNIYLEVKNETPVVVYK